MGPLRRSASGRSFSFGLSPYFQRLSAAFGWRYVMAIILTYGVNQGVGEKLVMTARQYFIFDGMGLDAVRANQVVGFSRIPWQLKSLFGVASDSLPIYGRHRGPYMVLAGVLGIIASAWLAALPAAAFSASAAAVLLLFANVNFAMPDVMIDATVAERAKAAPKRTADLQALCWGSLGVLGIPMALVKGYLLEAGGSRLLFALSVLTSACVLAPPLLGWLGEARRPGGCAETRRLCRSLSSTLAKQRVLVAATLVGCYSLSLGLVQLVLAPLFPDEVGMATLVANFGLCACLYCTMRPVDEVLARAVIYPFLRGALTPRSEILFDWHHAPAADSGDERCWTAERCLQASGLASSSLVAERLASSSGAAERLASALASAAANNASAAGALLNASFWATPLDVALDAALDAALPATATATATAGSGAASGVGLPCGWARARGHPCLSPVLLSYVSLAGSAALVGGTVAYTTLFQTWRYRSIIAVAQLLLLFANLTDWVWTERWNLAVGLPDEWLVFGEEVFIDALDQLNSQPFFIFAAKLCPPDVEASMFALFMGLSNFGADAGKYLGSSVLKLVGDPVKPAYDGLGTYCLVKSLMRALPILLIPLLVPAGSPADSAAAMGAGKGVTDGGGESDGADLRLRTEGSSKADDGPADEREREHDGVAGELELGASSRTASELHCRAKDSACS